MTDRVPFALDCNPFASYRTRPGALEFCFPPGASTDSLIDELCEHGWRGQIVGPHGAGKSTLIAAILPGLHGRGLCTRTIALHDGQRRLPRGFLKPYGSEAPLVLVVDGYEQLSFFERITLRWHCWRRGGGLLITTHSPAFHLTRLLTLAPSSEVLKLLMQKLLAGSRPLVDEHAAAVSFSRHGGNFREVWFDLYDQYERNRRNLAVGDRQP